MNVLDLMRVGPVIPVIVLEDIAQAVPLARALVAGGVRVLEVTLRTAAGLPSIRAIAQEVPDAIARTFARLDSSTKTNPPRHGQPNEKAAA